MPLTPLYPVTAHPLLSAPAAALSGNALAAQTMVAETTLGLWGTGYTGDAKDRATLAVVRQVNLQVADPVDPTVQSESRGDRSVTYVTRNGVQTLVDAIALQIVEALAEDAMAVPGVGAFAPIRSLR